MIKVYIAGPMRGKSDYNIPEFTKAADVLRAMGVTVINPVELDYAYGLELRTLDFDTITDEIVCQCIRRDVEAICMVDAVVVLEDWQQSKGASAEVAIAKWRGIPVFSLKDFHPEMLCMIDHT